MKSIKYIICGCVALTLLATAAFAQGADFEKQVQEYIKKFSYQDTYNYAVKYTGSDPAKFNTWVLGAEPVLVRAGQDTGLRPDDGAGPRLHLADLVHAEVNAFRRDPDRRES
jgi:hypothetical protein